MRMSNRRREHMASLSKHVLVTRGPASTGGGCLLGDEESSASSFSWIRIICWIVDICQQREKLREKALISQRISIEFSTRKIITVKWVPFGMTEVELRLKVWQIYYLEKIKVLVSSIKFTWSDTIWKRLLNQKERRIIEFSISINFCIFGNRINLSSFNHLIHFDSQVFNV